MLQYIYEAAYKCFVVNGHQVFSHSIHAHFMYHVGGKHCKRMASLYKYMGDAQVAINLLRCESKIRL